MSPASRPRRPGLTVRGGFTLVEMLLVLVVLVTLATAVIPTATRFFGDYALKQSAEAVQNDLARARLDAVQQGVVYEFRAEAGGDRWVIVPASREPGLQGADGDTAPAVYVPVRSGTLAEGVTFASDGTLAALTDRPEMDYFSGLPDASQLAQLQWSNPIQFRADGTADDASVTLSDEEGGLRVVVRGLTGAAAVEPVPQPTLSGAPQLGTQPGTPR
ncbi:MAG: prepilin-type N-terminal cleavage/methylation domain-containing protein [Planctomycetota bacterium]